MESIYLAGPMTGVAEFNHPAFHEAERQLRQLGFTEIVNPAAIDRDIRGFDPTDMLGWQSELDDAGFDRHQALSESMDFVYATDAIVVLDGWTESTGATAEVAYGVALGHPVYKLGGDWLSAVNAQLLPLAVEASAQPQPIRGQISLDDALRYEGEGLTDAQLAPVVPIHGEAS